MAEFNQNRLQFVHHDECFKTVEEAKSYVVGQLDIIDRPALYAEPMILKYGDEKNPNILLAIGSIGDGVTKSQYNKTFFIDSASLEESILKIEEELSDDKKAIEDLQKIIKEIINACGLEDNGEYVSPEDPILKTAESLKSADVIISEYIQELEKRYDLSTKETNTVSLILDKTNNGQTLSADVKLATNKIINNVQIPNIIIVDDGKGIFSNIDLSYDDVSNNLTFSVNGETKVFNLPTETFLEKGEYDTKTESLILTLNTGSEVVIDVQKLIGEWTVLGENTKTPIILTKRQSKYEEQLHEVESYQDILEADVRIADSDTKKYNILKKTEDGRSLYVDGVAKNIMYLKGGKMITVQEAIDTVECTVSPSNDNIISKRIDGIFANVELEYNAANNVLTFKRSNVGGDVESKEIILNTASLLEDANYDPTTECIVLRFKTADGKISKVEIPVYGLIQEWEVDNTNTTVTLNKKLTSGAGTDKLSANVNIATSPYNILENNGHALYVKGTADNIKFDEDYTVEGKIKEVENSLTSAIEEETNRAIDIEDKLNKKIDNTIDALNEEQTRAEKAEEKLQDSIDAEVTRATTVESQLQEKVTLNTEAINAEVTRATTVESQLQEKVTLNTDAINAEVIRAEKAEEKLQDAINEANNKLNQEIKDRTDNDSQLNDKITLNSREIEKVKTIAETNSTNILTEKDRAEKAEEKLQDAILAEQTRAEKAEEQLNDAILAEQTRAEKADEQLNDAILAEQTRAISAEVKLQTNIDNVASDLVVTNDNLDKEITRAKDTENDLQTSITNVNDSLSSEIDRATKVEKVLSDNLAQTNTNLIAEQTRAEKAEEKLQDAINAEVTRATTVESQLQEKVTSNTDAINAEVTRATTVESQLQEKVTSNTDAINAEVIRAEKAEHDLSDALANTNTDLKNSIDTISLDYNVSTNTLEFKNGEGSIKTLKLNDAELLNNAYYDSTTETIVLSFKNEETEISEVRIPVSSIIEEWRVENSNKNVTLTRERHIGGVDSLSASVNISTKNGNLLQDVNNSLYVSNSANDIKLIDGTSVESIINSIIKSINDEIIRANNSEKIINDAINAEVTRATTVESQLQEKVTSNTEAINAEVTRATSSETSLDNRLKNVETGLTEETKNREISDININARIDALNSDLSTEIANRTNGDSALDDRIKLLETKSVKLETSIITEESNRKAADTLLETSITAEQTRAEKAEEKLQDAINAEQTRAEKAEEKLQDAIDSEVVRAKDSENLLKEKLDTVKSTLENEISKAISEIDINPISTSTIELIKNTSNLLANVKVSKESNNIIKSNSDGIFARNCKLTYDTALNALTFTNSLGESQTIVLNSIDTIKNIYFDGETNELVFLYTVEGITQEVRINAASFFKGIVGSDASVSEGHNITVATAITTTQGGSTSTGITANLNVNDIVSTENSTVNLSTNENKISASVNIAKNVPNNILEVDGSNSSLFVNGIASNIRVYFKNQETDVQTAINSIVSKITEAENDLSVLINRITNIEKTIETNFDEIFKELNRLNKKSTIIDDDYNDYIHQTFAYSRVEDGGDGLTHVKTELKEDLSRNPTSGKVVDF